MNVNSCSQSRSLHDQQECAPWFQFQNTCSNESQTSRCHAGNCRSESWMQIQYFYNIIKKYKNQWNQKCINEITQIHTNSPPICNIVTNIKWYQMLWECVGETGTEQTKSPDNKTISQRNWTITLELKKCNRFKQSTCHKNIFQMPDSSW